MLRNLDPNSSTERAFIAFLSTNTAFVCPTKRRSVSTVSTASLTFITSRASGSFAMALRMTNMQIQQRDAEQRQLIIARGDEVWSWHYRDDLAHRIAQRPDIFRKVR